MREIRPSGSEGGVRLNPSSLPLSFAPLMEVVGKSVDEPTAILLVVMVACAVSASPVKAARVRIFFMSFCRGLDELVVVGF